MTEIRGRLDGPVPVRLAGQAVGTAHVTADDLGVYAVITLDDTPAGREALDAVTRAEAALALTFTGIAAAPADPRLT